MYNKKICILGAPGVGKTSLVRRFTGADSRAGYVPTIGANIDKIQLHIDSDRLQLMLWDIQGEERSTRNFFDYLIGASAIVYVVDGTRLDSLDVVLELRRQIDNRRVLPLPSIMLFNKSDLSKAWVISPGVINNVEASGIIALLASAREGTGVNTAFNLLARVLAGKTTMVAA